MAEFNLTPVFRMEMFIDAIIHGTTPPEPQFREEFYFAKVAGMDVELPTPITRREFYLAKYAGMDVDPPAPVTRDEMYLALACGLGVEPPEPVFRDEYWLYELSGGGEWSWKTVSGSMIHITDAVYSPMQKCEVSLEPIQDLHGQDAPYPAGGGVNKFDQETLSNFSNYTNLVSSYYYTDKIQLKPNTNYYIYPTDDTALSGGYYVLYIVRGDDPDEIVISSSTVIYPVYGGAIGTPQVNRVFTTGSTGIIRFGVASSDTLASIMSKTWQMAERVGNYDPYTDGLDYSPYSNICTIEGWTGCEVTRTGKNLAPTSVPSNVIAGNFTTSSSTIQSAANARVFAIPVPKNTSIFVQKKSGSTSGHSLALGNTGSIVVGTSIYSVTGFTNSPEASLNTGEHGWLYVQSTNLTVANALFSSDEFMVTVGSSRATYEAPQEGTTLSATFPDSAGTVYGGTHEFVSGNGNNDRVEYTYDGTENWISNGANGYYLAVNLENTVTSDAPISNYCFGWIPGASAGLPNWSVRLNFTKQNLLVMPDLSLYDTVAKWKAFLAQNPLQVVFKKATPTEIQLIPQPISTLEGVNNVWSNGDSVEITYKAKAS